MKTVIAVRIDHMFDSNVVPILYAAIAAEDGSPLFKKLERLGDRSYNTKIIDKDSGKTYLIHEVIDGKLVGQELMDKIEEVKQREWGWAWAKGIEDNEIEGTNDIEGTVANETKCPQGSNS